MKKSLLAVSLLCGWVLWSQTEGADWKPIGGLDELRLCTFAANAAIEGAKKKGATEHYACFPGTLDPRTSKAK
jgi:hypothetical protein